PGRSRAAARPAGAVVNLLSVNWLWTNTAVALLLALLVAAGCRIARPRPAIAHALWLLVLLRLCLPPWLAVPLPIVWRGAGAAAPQVVDLSSDAVRLAAPPAPVVAPIVAIGAVPFTSTGTSTGTSAGTWLWFGGSSAMALLALASMWRGFRRYGAAPQPAVWVAAEVRTLAAQLGVRAPALADDPSASTPFVWPFGRPLLVVSTHALAAMAPPARMAVLAHELGHLARRDHWWLHGELLCAIAFFWHPLFWLLRARVREQAELACDAWALAAAPAARRSYASALIDALAREHPAPAVPVLAARPAARRLIERRLSMILHESVPCRLPRLALAGVASLALCLAVAPVRAQGRGESPRVEIRVDGRRLEDLSDAERERVLQRLGVTGEALRLVQKARALEHTGTSADEPQEPKPKPRPKPKANRPAADVDLQDTTAGVQDQVRAALDEARREIRSDADLRELGITKQVEGLIDSLGGRGDFQQSLGEVIAGAMKGAAKMAKREVQQDPDLKKLGIADSLGSLIDGLAGDRRLQEGLQQIVQQALKSAAVAAKVEIAEDGDLKKLGITADVSALLDDLGNGKLDLGGHLPKLIEKAMQGALQGAKFEVRIGDDEPDGEQPVEKRKEKAKDDKAKDRPKAKDQPKRRVF
ncbi:MAG TPA: M56 family metallopeptidase, partial [Burkholderiaceae bacterium]|nr:M56 family metallopeptidase [Burkholderiaceae bacterium]